MTKGHALLGPSGSGAAMKLAVNAMIAVTNESLAETLALAERYRDRARAGVRRSRRRRARLHRSCTTSAAPSSAPRRSPWRSRPTLMRKDIALAQDLAARLGVRIPAAAAAAAVSSKRQSTSGLADADMSSVIGLLASTTGRAPLTTNDDITEEK